jgi:CubicO group peptidase (beta-lactamase class C family)
VSPEEVGLSEDRIWRFKERLYSRVVARRVVGAEILVVKDRRIVLHQAMGWADRERLIPLERNAIFRIASMTKPLAGTALLMLMEDGRIALDDRPSFIV